MDAIKRTVMTGRRMHSSEIFMVCPLRPGPQRIPDIAVRQASDNASRVSSPPALGAGARRRRVARCGSCFADVGIASIALRAGSVARRRTRLAHGDSSPGRKAKLAVGHHPIAGRKAIGYISRGPDDACQRHRPRGDTPSAPITQASIPC